MILMKKKVKLNIDLIKATHESNGPQNLPPSRTGNKSGLKSRTSNSDLRLSLVKSTS
jgi:hypothetical protein